MFQIVAHGPNGAVLEGLHCPDGLSHDGRRLLEREVAYYSKGDHVALVVAETVEELDHLIGIDEFHGLGLDVAAGELRHFVVGRRRATLGGPPPIDGTAVGDDEHPRTERRLGPLEFVDVAGNLQEDFAGDVLGVGDSQARQISGDRAGEITVDLTPRGLIAASGPLDSIWSAEQADTITKLNH